MKNIPSLIFATNNSHKVIEIRQQLGDQFEIITLKDAGILIDIPEPHNTIEENASEKSKTILELTGKDCFSEDTGLEVAALYGEPGVKSARYVEKNEQFSSNIEKLLFKLKGKTNKNAKFRTVISLRLNGKETFFEGICRGKIIDNYKGINGFGYDPVFIPEGSELTFAEMTIEEKSIFSHRAKAVKKLAEFLKQ
ncbi:MAG: RdgB/HAM1 family non-canonical purine NTP pyrophosphatase [Bacteroidota bacterium]